MSSATGRDRHEHYEHYDPAMVERLDGAWGHVDRAVNDRIADLVPRGARVLDLGSGFGSLASRLARGRRAIGIDPLLACLAAARGRYTNLPALCGSAVELPLAGGSVEVAVMRDVLHHLADEAPIEKIFEELARCGVTRLIVVDPNPNPILLLARRLVGHVDPVCGPREAGSLLQAAGFRLEPVAYDILWSLPLSGGYVGPVLLPGWRALWTPLLAAERLLCRALDLVGLARFVCWRYILVATRPA